MSKAERHVSPTSCCVPPLGLCCVTPFPLACAVCDAPPLGLCCV